MLIDKKLCYLYKRIARFFILIFINSNSKFLTRLYNKLNYHKLIFSQQPKEAMGMTKNKKKKKSNGSKKPQSEDKEEKGDFDKCYDMCVVIGKYYLHFFLDI